MKFGGSCFQNSEVFRKVIQITEVYGDYKKLYIASAFKGVTDLLLEMCANTAEGDHIRSVMKSFEKIHMEIINDIFEGNLEYAKVAREYVINNMGKIKNTLNDIKEFGLESYYEDDVVSNGELISTYILSLYLKTQGYNVIFIPATKLIITDDNYKNAFPLFNFTKDRVKKKIMPLLEKEDNKIIFCITSFIGRNKMGYTTTLGRGGSDYTATVLARVIHELLESKDIKVILWKDVDGLLISNPKYVKDVAPRLVKKINYNEAKEMAFFGAQVLHPKCLEAVEVKKIPLEIRNFQRPLDNSKFTLISEETDIDKIKGISTIENVAMITVSSGSMVQIPGVLAKIFQIMGKNGINVSLVAQSSSEIKTTFVVESTEGDRAVRLLKESGKFDNFFNIRIEYVGIVAVIGLRIIDTIIKARIFSALSKKSIIVKSISQSSEGLNISLVINKIDIEKAVDILYKEFFFLKFLSHIKYQIYIGFFFKFILSI